MGFSKENVLVIVIVIPNMGSYIFIFNEKLQKLPQICNMINTIRMRLKFYIYFYSVCAWYFPNN